MQRGASGIVNASHAFDELHETETEGNTVGAQVWREPRRCSDRRPVRAREVPRGAERSMIACLSFIAH